MWGPLGRLTAETGDTDALAMIAQPWVYEPLARFDAGGNLAPALASRLVTLPGGRVAVDIREGATFSDGSRVTAGDIASSFSGKGKVDEVNGMIEILSLVAGVPTQALIGTVLIHRSSGDTQIGTGPFAVQKATSSELTLVRRQHASSRINQVDVLAYATPRDAFAHTLKGDANLIPDMEPRWLEFFHGVPSLKVVRGAGVSTDSIMFNMRLSRRERVALADRLESNDIRELAYGEECAETRSGRSAGREIDRGTPLDVLSWGPFERLASAARRGLGARAGKLEYLSPADTLRRMQSRSFDLLTYRPLFRPPVIMSTLWRTGAPENAGGYSNPDVDRALDAGDWAAARVAMRKDPPAAFICTRDRLAVVDSRIKSPVLGPNEILETLPEWEVAE